MSRRGIPNYRPAPITPAPEAPVWPDALDYAPTWPAGLVVEGRQVDADQAAASRARIAAAAGRSMNDLIVHARPRKSGNYGPRLPQGPRKEG